MACGAETRLCLLYDLAVATTNDWLRKQQMKPFSSLAELEAAPRNPLRECVVAIKIAPFNRYQSLDVVRAVIEAGRNDIALYACDDNIVADRIT